MSREPKKAPGLVELGAKVMVWCAGGSLIVMSFVVTAEALLRKYAGFSIGNVNEISAYVFAISSAWAFGWALLQGAHIRITALQGQFGRTGRAVLDLLAWFAFLVVFIVIAYRACDLAWESYVSGARAPTTTRTLLFIPQGLWALGLVATALVAVYVGYKALRDRSLQSMSAMDEVQAELEHLK